MTTTSRPADAPARLLALLGVLAVALALVAVPPAAGQQQDQGVTPARIDGENRFDTAANIASATFDTAEVAHIVTGHDFPDALAASYAAGAVEGPLLLVTRDAVPRRTWETLEALNIQRVVLVGGPQTISEAVEQELRDQGYEPERLRGQDRYQTAAAVAVHYGTQDGQVGTLAGERTALLASGEKFPDALAAGPLAAAANLPLLLTPRDQAHATVSSALEQLDIERIVVIGGPSTVASAVVHHYQNAGYTVERFAGDNRMHTATVVADNAVARFGFTSERILLARGDDYPDALAASVHGGLLGAPILLTATPTVLSGPTSGWLSAACPQVDIVRAIGGPSAVSEPVLGEAVDTAERCEPAPTTNQNFHIEPAAPVHAEVGTEHRFELVGTYDDGPLNPVELALFPCEVVTISEDLIVTFADADADGYADRSGESDTDHAWISRLEGHPQQMGQDRSRAFPDDPEGYTFHIASNAPDCTVPVIWGPGDDQRPTELPVDENGEPTDRFGIGWIEFS